MPGMGALLWGGGTAVVLAWFCVQWIDAPLAIFLHAHKPDSTAWLLAFTHIPNVLVLASVLTLLLAPLRAAWRRPLTRVERTALAMALSLAVAAFLKEALKYVFGRAWPETWTHGNPSLIHDHVYGFFWLQRSAGFHSFPSGHATLTSAAMLPWWERHRWARIPAALICLLVTVGLLGLNYHFLGDIVAGAALGSACAVYITAALPFRRKG